MKKLFLAALSTIVLATGAQATEAKKSRDDIPAEICVRNYLKPDGGMDPCGRSMPGFAMVIDKKDTHKLICTRTYDDSHCKNSPREFDHALMPNGKVVCTINYHQPPISANCASSPELYDWVTAAYIPNK